MKLKFNIGYPTAVLIPLLFVFSLLLVFSVSPKTAKTGKTAVRPPAKTTSSCKTAATPRKTIYLTFDDGPYRYTDELLQVLAQNQVKATFFVTNCHPEYINCIAKEYEAGHAIGVHSYSHNYSQIYSSDRAYWDDFHAMDEIIYEQTGHHTKLLRFPGGSSNLVSRKYSRGIMKRLTREAAAKGLTYFDWDVQGGDCDGLKTSYGVYRRMISQVSHEPGAQHIVLCHDIKPYTVSAVNQFIQWARANGYSFAVLEPDSFTVHQQLNN